MFELIVMIGLAGGRESFGEYPTLEACRVAAHKQVGDPSPFDPTQHLFMSPNGTAKAYCRVKR